MNTLDNTYVLYDIYSNKLISNDLFNGVSFEMTKNLEVGIKYITLKEYHKLLKSKDEIAAPIMSPYLFNNPCMEISLPSTNDNLLELSK